MVYGCSVDSTDSSFVSVLFTDWNEESWKTNGQYCPVMLNVMTKQLPLLCHISTNSCTLLPMCFKLSFNVILYTKLKILSNEIKFFNSFKRGFLFQFCFFFQFGFLSKLSSWSSFVLNDLVIINFVFIYSYDLISLISFWSTN